MLSRAKLTLSFVGAGGGRAGRPPGGGGGGGGGGPPPKLGGGGGGGGGGGAGMIWTMLCVSNNYSLSRVPSFNLVCQVRESADARVRCYR